GIEGDIHEYFEALAACDSLPTLDELLEHASLLRERYASQTAYNQSLSKEEHDDANPRTQAPTGSPWTAPCAPEESTAQPRGDTEMPGLSDIPDDSAELPDIHTEEPGFDGDRVFSNAILFMMEFGWWVELNYAIPERDIGRVLEILKILIFTFAGTSHQNCMGYMLDLYALLKFECSPELKEALLNNWLMNLLGEIGRCIEADLMQEHFNRWLEDMVGRRGEELHLFRSGRSMGHAAVNRFDRGYQRLEGGKMAEFLERSAVYADIVQDME
ncbi:hypothetical protein B0H13DRAFT_1529859, partial [Mycena leptocephala]